MSLRVQSEPLFVTCLCKWGIGWKMALIASTGCRQNNDQKSRKVFLVLVFGNLLKKIGEDVGVSSFVLKMFSKPTLTDNGVKTHSSHTFFCPIVQII